MASTSNLSAKFNDFLFATVCEDGDEMPLSVLSALARLDLDPWTEAAELARMPADGAARRLSSLLAGVVKGPPAQSDRATIAARLVALLPTSPTMIAASHGPAPGAASVPKLRLIRIMCLVFLAWMAANVLIGNLAPRAGLSGPASGPIPATGARR